MDLQFSEEQTILRNSARSFLKQECPTTPFVRKMEFDETGYTAQLWQSISELGWLGILFPEEYGGAGFEFIDLAILLEEMGRACMPGPFLSTVLCGLLILQNGNTEQKNFLLPKIISGESVLTYAITEQQACYAAAGIQMKAAPVENNDYILNGTKMFVSDAHVVDSILCFARTSEGADPEKGISVFLVDPKLPGITCFNLEDTIARDKLYGLEFKDVRIPDRNIIGKLNNGWKILETLLAYGAVSECARMLGGAKRVLEMSLDYAKTRKQYQKLIGSNQIIQHYLVDMSSKVDGIDLVTYEAAWKLSKGFSSDLEIAIAKAWVSDAYYEICVSGHQIHGGIGFVDDHDMGLYYRRAKAQELNFGNAEFYRRKIAQLSGCN